MTELREQLNMEEWQGEDWLHDPLSFHRPRKTWTCLACLSPGGTWQQKWVPTWSLHEELRGLDLSQDWWISQAEFSERTRDISHVAYLQSSFLDLDWRKCRLWAEGLLPEPQEGAEMVLSRCRALGIPEPNIITFSGNGLHLKWVYRGPIPAAALPRWNAVQRFLCRKLSDFGADPSSLDAARVLRLPGSRNGKPDTPDRQVRVLHHSSLPYTFDNVASAVLPVAREEIRSKSPTESRNRRRSDNIRHLGIAGMYAHRYGDIQRLIAMRRDKVTGNVPKGNRELMAFWGLLCQARAGLLTTANFDAKAQSLIEDMGPAFALECRPQAFGTLRRILSEVESGDRWKEWKGRRVPKLYRIRTCRLIEILNVTPEEQRELKVIIGPEEKQRRRTEKRRSSGVQPRAEWLAEHDQERRRPWDSASQSRRTWFTKKSEDLAAAAAAVRKFRDELAAAVAVMRQCVEALSQWKQGQAAHRALGCLKTIQDTIQHAKTVLNNFLSRLRSIQKPEEPNTG